MAFFHLHDLDLSMPHLGQDAEVMVMGSLASLDMKLVNNIVVADLIRPDLLHDRVLELAMQLVMVVAEDHELVPVAVYLFVNRNF